jgi:hypothetical protein
MLEHILLFLWTEEASQEAIDSAMTAAFRILQFSLFRIRVHLCWPLRLGVRG